MATVTTCGGCGAAVPTDARFCPRCGHSVEYAPHAERRLATVLFADIVGSTEVATSVDPEDLREELTAFFDTCSAVIAECGGRIEKFIGDAVMAVFGVPRAYGDDVDRAVTAGTRLVERLTLPIRVGINTGEVLAVDTDPEEPMSVTGEAVHAAARLQAAAAPGQVLLGERTARAVRAHRVRALGEITVKGFPRPLLVWEAAGTHQVGDHQSPFVGRDEELQLLDLVHARSVRRQVAHVACVFGEPGSGKSRMAAELLDRLTRQSPHGRTIYLASSPVQLADATPVLGQLARALLDDSALPVGQLRAAVTQRLRDSSESIDVDTTARWISISAGDTAAGDSDGIVDQQAITAWARLLRTTLIDRPLTIVVDDAQWADEALLQILAAALNIGTSSPLLVVVLSRPGMERDFVMLTSAAAHVIRLELLPLAAVDASRLAAHHLHASPESVRDRVVARAGGNPFFLIEMARGLHDAPSLPETVELPDTVQANVVARLDALPLPARQFLQVASVVGQDFDVKTVAALGADPSDDLVETLVRRDFLVSSGGSLAFRHGLIREVAYTQLPRTTRAQLHEQAAQESRSSGDPAIAATAVDHVLRAAQLAPTAERLATAYRMLRDAAKDAQHRGRGRHAQQLLEQAADVATDATPRLAAFRYAARIAFNRWDGDETIRLYLRLADAAAEAGQPAVECEAMLNALEVGGRFVGTVHHQYTYTELAGWFGRMQQRLPADDSRLAVFATVIRCWVDVHDRHLTDDEVEQALRLATGLGDPRIESLALDTATSHHWTNGRHEMAAELAAQRGAVVDRIVDPLEAGPERSDTLLMAADTSLMVGDVNGYRRATDALQAFESGRGNDIVGWTRQCFVRYFDARWDELLELIERVPNAWAESGNRLAGFIAPGVWAAAAVCRIRGEDVQETRWSALAEEMSGGGANSRAWSDILIGDSDIHLGRPLAAIERLDASVIKNQELLPFHTVTRIDAAITAGTADVANLALHATATVSENRYARAILKRATAIMAGNRAELLAAHDELQAAGGIYQAARTGMWLGGEHEAAARDLFARMQVPPPHISRVI